jgi:hypothetical protein
MEEREQLAVWVRIYRDEFGIVLDASQIKIPAHQEGFDRLIVVAEGLTPERIFWSLKRRMPASKYWDDLDGAVSVRKTEKAYAVWVRDRVEADEELKNKSANDLGDSANCIALEERLLLEIAYFRERGNNLDIVSSTLCAGSHFSQGSIPTVGYRGGAVYVGWEDPGNAEDFLRVREVKR